jgi:hypothetical protein
MYNTRFMILHTRKNLLTILMTFVVGLVIAQEQNYIHNRTVMERIPTAAAGTAISLGSLSYSPVGTVGDVYLNKDYRNATFWLYDGNQVAQGFPTKLDLQRNEFDVLIGQDKGVRALPGNKVRTFVWVDSLTSTRQYFVNAGEYKDDEGTPYRGFFMILSEGEITLLKLNRVIFKAADTRPTHNTGSKDNRFIKSADVYYAVGNKAMKLPGRKGILKLMESQKAAIDKFIEINDLDLGKEWHQVMLFDHYNSLVKK